MITIPRFLLGLLLVSLFAPIPQDARKQTSPRNSKDPCDWAMTQMELNQCTGDQYHKADARLNAVYRKLMDSLGTDVRGAVAEGRLDQQKYAEAEIQKLKATEKAWIQYRDLHCDAAKFEVEGGSMSPMTWNGCMAGVTDHRIVDLKNAYELSGRTIE